jgi:pyrroline-5-carboxylate reductase
MLRGWRERGLAHSVVLDPAPDARALAGPGVSVVAEAGAIPEGFRPACVVLAVKPQVAADALPAVAAHAAGAVALSIMAGRALAGIARLLPGVPVVRAMPNTPAAIGQGISAAYAGPGVSPAQAQLCGALLEAAGEVAWVEDEGQLDAVTAVSGSGPAYVFLLAELLERAAVEEGLLPALARRLARATVAGSGALLVRSGEDAAALRQAVTSPGGTTQAALAVLMDEAAWPSTLARAVAAAAARSRELAG